MNPCKYLKVPPSILRLEFDNMPNKVGTKPDSDKPLRRFIPSPCSTFLNKEAQKRFDDMIQEMSPNILVRRGVQTHRSPRLTVVTESQKAKLVVKVACAAMKEMDQIAALQECFNERFEKDSFMAGLIEDAQYTRMMVHLKKVAVQIPKGQQSANPHKKLFTTHLLTSPENQKQIKEADEAARKKEERVHQKAKLIKDLLAADKKKRKSNIPI